MSTTEIAARCHACGTALQPGSPFCSTCGASVPPTARAAAAGRGVDVSPVGAAAAPVPAPPGRRVAALLIDYLVSGVVVVVAYLVLVAGTNTAIQGGADQMAVAGFFGILIVPSLVQVAYFVVLLVWEGRAGKTIGNLALGIRTVSVYDGRPPGFGRAFVRRFIEGLGNVVLVGSYVIAASSAWDRPTRRQGWHDKVAGTAMVTAVSLSADAAGAQVPKVPQPAAAMGPVTTLPAVTTPPAVPPQVASPAAPAWPAVLPPVPSGGLIDAVPGVTPEESATDEGARTPVVVSPPPSAPRSGTAPSGRRSAAPAPEGAVPPVGEVAEDVEHTAIRAPRPVHAGAYALRFDTGESLTVTGSGLVGRNPAPGPGESVDHVIPIADPDRSVSKTHLAFGVGPDGFWILDRGSTNGTSTVSPDGARVEAPSGTPVTVPVGSTVEFGDRRFTVSAP